MKVLVAGGSGFIGTNFIKLLLDDSSNLIINFDLDVSPLRDQSLRTIVSDIGNPLIGDYVKDVDWVVNFASHTHVDYSILNPHQFVENNVLKVMPLLEAVKDFKKPYLYVSTDEVYGEIKEGTVAEDGQIKPGNPYAVSKASADMMVQAYIRTYGIKARIVRMCNNYGPYQKPDKFIPKCITNILRNRKVPLYGDGSQVRQWIFVEDACRAIETVILHGQDGEVYNIGGPSFYSNLETAKRIIGLMRPEADKERLISFVADRPGHDFRYGVSSDKVRRLGWDFITTFDVGLEKTIMWHKCVRSCCDGKGED